MIHIDEPAASDFVGRTLSADHADLRRY